jgi:hypothetical protein
VSYDATAIDIVASEGFAIPRTLWRDLALGEHSYLERAPEGSFLSPQWPSSGGCQEIHGILFVKRIDWTGEGSGYSWDLFEELLTKFIGGADLIVTWEGGDSLSGLRLLNGKVTKHCVIRALGEETK